MASWEVANDCKTSWKPFSTKSVASTLILVPINKDIVNSAVKHKVKRDGLTTSEADSLQMRSERELLTGPHAIFLLFVISDGLIDTPMSIVLPKLNQYAKVKLEDNREFSLEKYTRIFDSELTQNLSTGYLYFENFRASQGNSYSMHFKLVVKDCEYDWSEGVLTDFWHDPSFSFDTSELNIVEQVQNKIPEREIRARHNIYLSKHPGVHRRDILRLLPKIVDAISSFSG